MDEHETLSLAPWAVAINLPAGDGEFVPSAEVIPAPNAEGIIQGRDGRRYRVPDMRALASRIAGQRVKARIDFDHRSERISPTFAGSTRSPLARG